MLFLPTFGYQQPAAPMRRTRSNPTRPPRVMTILAMLALLGGVAFVGYHIWLDAHQPTPAIDLRYPGADILLLEHDDQTVTKEGVVGPVEDRIYGIPTSQAATVSYQAILAWYHTRLVALGWSFQNANPLSQYLAGENWMKGCEYLSVRIWDPKLAEPDFNDPKVYPITFELYQRDYCPNS